MATGVVKFFNPAKGFGFISPDNGGADVFVHVSAVERARLSSFEDGDQVSYELESDRRLGKLAAVDLQVTGSAPAGGGRPSRSAAPSRGFAREDWGFRPGGSRGGDRESAGSGSGVVKWFDTQKGFGFIQPSDGSSEVFVLISAVERPGLSDLREGQPVAYEIEQDRRTGKASATTLRID